jgi:3D (Asp-Asp-Asp) domain-containing protein
MTTGPSACSGSSEVEPELACSAAPAPRGIAGFVTDLLGRIVRRIKGMAPVAFALGCQSTETPPTPRPEPSPPPPASVSVAEEPAEVSEAAPAELGKFNITFYYIVGEDEIVARPSRKKEPANENHPVPLPLAPAEGGAAEGGQELAATAPPETVTLYGPGGGCDRIAETTREFAYELMLQGTGKLRDGRFVTVWGRCNCPNSPCFRVTEQQWGTGAGGRPLQPFRSVGVDPKLIKLGTLLYIPLLEGRTMPGRPPWGGFVHDGCVLADDTGGGVKNHQLDLFVGRKAWFLGMSGHPGRHSWAHQIPVFDGSRICEHQGRKISRKTGAI